VGSWAVWLLWLASVMPVGLCVAKRFVAGISDPSHNRQAERSLLQLFPQFLLS